MNTFHRARWHAVANALAEVGNERMAGHRSGYRLVSRTSKRAPDASFTQTK